MRAAHKEYNVPDFFPLRNKLFMQNVKCSAILETEKNEIDIGASAISNQK